MDARHMIKQFVAEVNGAHGARFRVFTTGDDRFYLFELIQNTDVRTPVAKADHRACWTVDTLTRSVLDWSHYHPAREIDMSQPMTVTFEQDGREIKVVQHTQKYTHVTVSSSKPDHEPYDVVVRPDTIRCACRGNLFRGHCSHSDAVRAVINRAN